jgi:hypothetical protein
MSIMVRIRRFGVVRTSNVVALWTLVVGLIFFIPIAVILAAAGDMTTTDQFGRQFTFNGGAAIAGILIFIVFYAGFLWVFTAIGLLVYNLVAGLTGGVEIELFQPPPPVYVPGPAWGQQPSAPPGGYGTPTGYQGPPAGGYQPPSAPPAPPADARPRSYDPAPMAQPPTYDPAPRWEPPGSTPPQQDRGDERRD